jgi:glyoxylase-like metal-dependent hydrolase (beta-lactamase superfamily II)
MEFHSLTIHAVILGRGNLDVDHGSARQLPRRPRPSRHGRALRPDSGRSGCRSARYLRQIRTYGSAQPETIGWWKTARWSLETARTRQTEEREGRRPEVGSVDAEPGATFRVLTTGHAVAPVQVAFGEADAGEVAAALGADLLAGRRIETPFNCALLLTRRGVLLLDSGVPDDDGAAPPVVAALREVGISPAMVDLVIISHAHLDHIGGLLSNGRPVFENAEHVLAAEEWRFFVVGDDSCGMDPGLYAGMREDAIEFLQPLGDAGQLRLLDGEERPWPGVHVFPAPGHTPGHLAVRVSHGVDEFLYLGDALLHEVMVEHPEWTGPVDTDPVATVRTRLQLLEQATSATIAGGHLRGLGKVTWSGDHHRWLPTR